MENRNVIIGLLVVVLIALALLAFKPTMYGPGYSPGGYYPPWSMGPGMGPGMMYGPGYGPGYNYSSHMMGYGAMMALYYSGAKPISSKDALQRMESFARQYGSNVEVEDFMAFSGNYYAVLKDTDNNLSLAEVLVDRYSGSAYPEPGPNTIWNTRYGSGRVGAGGTAYDLAGAKRLAEDFLKVYLPGAKIMEANALPGYYTFDFGRQEIEGMLSVNAYSGEIWVHTWHGFYLGGREGNATS
jgi:hypothetical protein